MKEGKSLFWGYVLAGIVILGLAFMFYSTLIEAYNGNYFVPIYILLLVSLLVLLKKWEPIKSASLGKKHIIAFLSYSLIIMMLFQLGKDDLASILKVSPLILLFGYMLKVWIYSKVKN